MALAEHHDAVEALLFDGPHEALRVGVQIRAPWRQLDRLGAAALEDLAESTSEEWIPVVNQVPRRKPSTTSVRFRAICSIHSPNG